jgi:hypothetical protein
MVFPKISPFPGCTKGLFLQISTLINPVRGCHLPSFARREGKRRSFSWEYPVVQKKTLVGGAITILKNMKVNGKDDIPYIIENNIHV